MAWECSDCGRKEEGKSKITICHHCGKPICKLHRKMIEDDAFSIWEDHTATNIAVHCTDCRQKFHPQAMDVVSGAPGIRGPITA